MKISLSQKSLVLFKIFLLFLILFYFCSIPTSAQTEQKMLLSFRSAISYQGTGAYGTAGVEIKSEGYSYVTPKKDGTFSGTGEINVTITFTYPPNPAISLSPLKGRGSIQVKAKKKDQFLNFWFEHGIIPCKGIMTIHYPPPMGTEKKDHVQDFDPHTLAPGSFEIELKDGAEKVVDYGAMPVNPSPQAFTGKTTFYLDGIESWRVAVEGEEIDNLQPSIDNPYLKATTGELPISTRYTYNLIAEFSTLGKGAARSYYDGYVFSSILNNSLVFEHYDLYRCSEKDCEGSQDIDFSGEQIDGNVSGNTVQLKWPQHVPTNCVTCVPRSLGKLGQTVYERTFRSTEFLSSLSSEKIPLQHGKVINRSKGDYLKYKITLIKVQ